MNLFPFFPGTRCIPVSVAIAKYPCINVLQRIKVYLVSILNTKVQDQWPLICHVSLEDFKMGSISMAVACVVDSAR